MGSLATDLGSALVPSLLARFHVDRTPSTIGADDVGTPDGAGA